MKRSFLLLQGPATPFFARLAQRLRAEGHAVHRVHFCTGDVLYGGGGRAFRFRGPADALIQFLDEVYRRHRITDQVLFGDRRPVHRLALAHGQACGVRTHVFEGGYFRPWWITLEREGVNAHSHLPRDPLWYRDNGARLGEPPEPVRFAASFKEHAFHYTLYHLASAADWILFPEYRRHLPFSVPVELAGFARRFVRLRLIGKRERRRAMAIAHSGQPYFILPLQTNADAQILHHSQFAHMGEVIEHTLESFARCAPSASRIVIKNHPLDEGLMDYPAIIRACVKRFDLAGRVEYLEDGDFNTLAHYARGVVTVNSTAGIAALERGTPTLTLSDPIYNLPGMTCQSHLDDFWRDPVPPDPELFQHFRRVVMHTTQINGGFYCRKGIELAVENAARRLTAKRSPLETLL